MDQPFLCRKTSTETEKTRHDRRVHSLPDALILFLIGGDNKS